jgi:DUF4097 and DUF4098 domain-containing protein YvlB
MASVFKRITSQRWACICLALVAAGPVAARVHAGEYTKSFSISNHANVQVDTDGSVTVTTGDTKQVEFRVQYIGFEIDKTLQIKTDQQGDEIKLSAHVVNPPRLTIGVRRVHIEARMPTDSDLRVDAIDGSIKASGLTGEIELHIGNGSISGNSLKGAIRLHTGNGSIDASDLDGNCDAVSNDGRIRLAGRFDVLQARSGNGRIDVIALRGSKVDSSWGINSGHGSINVALPSDLQVDVEASTNDGRVSSVLPLEMGGILSRSRVRGKMNGGGQTLTIHTGDSSIHLKQS